jgi:hypothetical protein
VAALAFGCASAASKTEDDGSVAPPAGTPPVTTPPLAFGNYPQLHDGLSGLTLIWGTPDLGVGPNRLAFAITGSSGFVSIPVLSLRTYYYGTGDRQGDDRHKQAGPLEEVEVRFHEFPLGTRGSYVGEATFDRPGDWGFEVSVPRPDGSVSAIEFRTPVAANPRAPAIGSPAPRTRSPTLATAGSLARLTTASEPDPALYELSIADAIDTGRPTVVVFTSPAFCTTPLCGPQVEVLTGLRGEFGDRANFIHVDLYEAPDEIKGDLSRARRSAAVTEWGLETDEWTFLIDRSGKIAGRFESFAFEDELRDGLYGLVGETAPYTP